MIEVFAKHPPYNDGHLGEVVAEMQRMGPPALRVIWHDGRLIALEGSHRLAACHHLGLTPLLLVEEPDVPPSPHWRDVVSRLPAYCMNVIVISSRIVR